MVKVDIIFITYSQIVQVPLNKVCYFVKQLPSLRSIHCSPRTPQFKSYTSCLYSFVYISLEQDKNYLPLIYIATKIMMHTVDHATIKIRDGTIINLTH